MRRRRARVYGVATRPVVVFDPERHRRRSIRLQAFDYTSAGAYFVTIVTHRRRRLFGHIKDGVIHLSRPGEIVAACWTSVPQHFPHVAVDEWVVMPNHVHGILIIGADRTGEASARRDGPQTDVGPGDASPRRGGAAHRGLVSGGAGMDRRKGEAPVRGDGGQTDGDHADASPLRVPAGTRRGSIGAVIQNIKSVSARRIRADVRGLPWGPDGPDDAGASGLRVWHRNYYEHVIRDERSLERIRRYIRENPRAWAHAAHPPAAPARERA